MKWQTKDGFHWLDEAPYSARVEKSDSPSGRFFWVVAVEGETYAMRYAEDLSKAMMAAELVIRVVQTIRAIPVAWP